MTHILTIQQYSRYLATLSVSMIALSAFLYASFMLMAVGRAAEHADLLAQTQIRVGELSALQTKYLAASRDLTPERAKELGFVVPERSAIAYVNTAQTLTLNIR